MKPAPPPMQTLVPFPGGNVKSVMVVFSIIFYMTLGDYDFVVALHSSFGPFAFFSLSPTT